METTDVVRLRYQLEPGELQDLQRILDSVGISIGVELLRTQAGVEGFLGMLYRLDASARMALAEVLRQEFERFVPDLARALSPRDRGARRGSLGEAIAAAFERANKALPSGTDGGEPHTTEGQLEFGEARDLLRMVFALAWLDRPAPLDLLARRLSMLFACYDDVRVVAERHGFLAETELDADGTPALTPVNPGVARVLRHHVVGYTGNVLAELGAFANALAWPRGDDAATLTGWPRFVFELLRSVSPVGSFANEFGAADDVDKVLEILQSLRESRGLRLPQTLMLEAITRREWVRSADLSESERVEPLETSCRLLEEARDQVSHRPKSPARDHLLVSILAAYATTLRRLMEVRIELGNLPEAQEIARPALAAAQHSQALQDNWHPFDVAALIYVKLARAWKKEEGHIAGAREEYIDAVDRLGTILDLGELGELPYDQRERQSDRHREYLLLTNQLELLREKALAEAAEGKLTGLCYMLRLDAIDPETNRVRSAGAAASAFRTLKSFPAAFDDQRSIVLLQRLWVGARLGQRSLDSGPYVIRATPEEWRELQAITQQRIALTGDDIDPGVRFWLALALLQLGNIPESRRVLQQMQASIGYTRKRHFDPLVVLSDLNGGPRLFRALIRRREERETLLVYVRDLDLEMRLPRRHLEAGEAINLRQGDIIDVHISLNYRGPMALGPRWSARSICAVGA